MASSQENLSSVNLGYARLKDSFTLATASDSRLKQTPNCNLNLNPHKNYETILDPTLDYISRYLLEEDVDENISQYKDMAALHEMEKPFYEVLGERYPPSRENQLYASSSKVDHISITCLLEDQETDNIKRQNSRIDGNLTDDEFWKGMKEGMKFLPTIHKLTVDLQGSNLSSDSEQKADRAMVKSRLEEEDFGSTKRSKDMISGNADYIFDLQASNITSDSEQKADKTRLEEEDFGPLNRSNEKKSNNADYIFKLEGRNRKKPMMYYEEVIRNDMFDKVLLHHGESYEKEEVSGLQEIIQNRENLPVNNEIQDINLHTLLIRCSEAASTDNRRVFEELLLEIRRQSPRTGSGIQRLASILVDGLEARLAGSGGELYRRLVKKRICTIDILKAYHLFITAAPFYRVSYCFANTNIIIAIQNARKVHIVDLGIGIGFQWPSLFQSLASRQGGAPKLRITGVDFPRRGFHPSERVDEVGKRLEDYARSFNISFRYQGIASQWESICIEDLNIDEDEFLIVNSMFRFSRVQDEITTENNPRNRVLHLVQQMRPQLFIQGIFQAAFSSFFNIKFQQVLSCYSKIFDIFDSLISRDNMQRKLMETEVLSPIIINLIACEDSDWLERPETYKAWQLRNVRAGLKQLPLVPNVVNECRKKLKYGYDKRFFIEEDGNWMLQGWKGKIMYAFSTWKPIIELEKNVEHF